MASSKCIRASVAAGLIGGAIVVLPAGLDAHAFGRQFVLPLPVSFYLYGGAAAVLVSFVVIAMFTTHRDDATSYREIDVTGPLGWLVTPAALRILRVFGAVVFLALIVAGLAGHQIAGDNLASVTVWIVGYLGIAYLSAMVGNVWRVVGPFRVFARFAERTTPWTYPAWLGHWPAVVGLYIFIWLELLSGSASGPRETALALVVYYSVCLIGVSLFGLAIWFERADFLSVFYRVIGRVGMLGYRDGRLTLRAPFVGALTEPAVDGSLGFFVLLMLSSTALDGFRETTVWDNWLAAMPGTTSDRGRLLVETATLLISPGVFFLAYSAALWLMATLTRTPRSVGELAGRFALTLLPIAFVYHFAHYFTLLLVQGQAVLALVSDPFGQGWNLFGTAGWLPNAGIIGARTIWNVQVTAILAGHIASVYLAHRVALSLFPSSTMATRSQLPMLVLMVAYTVFGLWILAQPMNPAG